MKPFLTLLAAAALLTGCTSITVRQAPSTDLSKYHRIFVEQPFNENHHMDELLVNELKRTGREASSGPLTMMPDDADAILRYGARWTGDFSTSLLDLSVELETSHTHKPLANGRYYQPSAVPKKPEYVVEKLVTKLFAK